MEKRKTPRIRFKGFSDDWEQRKLIDVCDYVDYRGKTPDKTKEGIFLVTAKNIKHGYIDYEISKEYIDEKNYTKVMQRGFPRIGDVLITTEAPCGNVAQIDYEYVAIAQRVIKYRGHHQVIDNIYLKNYLMTPYFQTLLEQKSSGGTVQGIKGSTLHQQRIKYPYYIEQEKIGLYFKQLDTLITLHQRKLKVCKIVIRYYYIITWEQRKLGNMGSTFSGLSGKSKEDFGHGSAQFVTYMNVFSQPVADFQMTEPIEIDNKQNKVQYGDILFTTSSETPDEVGMSSVWLGDSDNVYLNSFCFGYRPEIELEPYYMAYMLRSYSVRKRLIVLAQGISRYNISKNRVMEIEVPIASLEEQKKIGAYFKQLDQLITLHQRQQNSWKLIEKGVKLWMILTKNQILKRP